MDHVQPWGSYSSEVESKEPKCSCRVFEEVDGGGGASRQRSIKLYFENAQETNPGPTLGETPATGVTQPRTLGKKHPAWPR